MRIEHAENTFKLPKTRNWNYQFETVLVCSNYGITRKRLDQYSFLSCWPSLQIKKHDKRRTKKEPFIAFHFYQKSI